MDFTVYDFSDYFGSLDLVSTDYATETSIDVSMFYDDDREEWDDEAIRTSAEATVRARFGEDAKILW